MNTRFVHCLCLVVGFVLFEIYFITEAKKYNNEKTFQFVMWEIRINHLFVMVIKMNQHSSENLAMVNNHSFADLMMKMHLFVELMVRCLTKHSFVELMVRCLIKAFIRRADAGSDGEEAFIRRSDGDEAFIRRANGSNNQGNNYVV